MRLRALVLVSVFILLVWLGILAVLAWAVHDAWEARFVMTDQPMQLRLPAGTVAEAQVTSPIRTHLNLRPTLRLPLDQMMAVRIVEPLTARAAMKTSLPVDTVVEVDTVVPVSTTLDMKLTIKSWLPRVAVTVPVALTLPIRMSVPVRLDIPVDLDLDVHAEPPPLLQIPVRGMFTLSPRVQGDIQARMEALTRFRVVDDIVMHDVRIARADIRVPVHLARRLRPLP